MEAAEDCSRKQSCKDFKPRTGAFVPVYLIQYNYGRRRLPADFLNFGSGRCEWSSTSDGHFSN